MKFVIFCTSLIISSLAFAGDNTCIKTRSCVEDKNCRIYAFKHNCYGVCQSKTIVSQSGTSTQCPLQCACLKVETQEKKA